MGTSVPGERWAGIIHLTHKSNIASDPDMQNLPSRAEDIQLKHQKQTTINWMVRIRYGDA